jgi:hypothetical protein
MGNLDLGTLIVAGIAGIGLIQLSMWVVVMIRHPGVDDFRLDLVEAASAQSGRDTGAGVSRSEK